MSDEYKEKWPEMRMKHLELIQNAITRMGANSSNLKSYCMAMVAAVIGLAAAVSKEQILIYTLPVVIAFALLDGNYLCLERGFINQYNEIRRKNIDRQPDFIILPRNESLARAYFSWSIIGFYGAIITVMGLVYFAMPEIVEAS
ncbi:MAG: hypothetical protein AAF543_07590 [Pseudomonadota bacterium]